MGLTVKRIARLVNSKEPGRYGDGGGLYLQVPRIGKKGPSEMREMRASWLFRYERGGKEHWMGLGKFGTFNLDEARERARKAQQQLQDGIDPLEALHASRAAHALNAAKVLTFEEATRQYYGGHERKWKNPKHRQQFINTLTAYAFPKIGKLPVKAIDTGLVLKCVEPIWQDKTETASRVRGRIEAVLDWCTARDYRSGDNPARWKGHLDTILATPGELQKITHHAALPFAELPDFLTAVRERGGVGAQALEFTILTATRTSEALDAKWDEFDLDGKLWTVPAERMKAHKEHRVPLSERAVEILRSLPREDDNPFVFIGNKKGQPCGSLTMWQVLKRMKRGDITVHGFRSTFRDWASEKTAYPNHVIEMALAHSIGSKVEASYRRGDLLDKRRKLMEAWSKYCVTPPAKKATGDVVVSIREATR